MTNAIILDIDGTLSDPSHRRPIINEPEKPSDEDWNKFFSKIGEDPANNWCVNLAHKYKETHKIIVVTARPGTDQIIEDTVQWLGDKHIPYDELHFRPEGDRRPDQKVKKEILEEEITADIEFVVDDRKKVVDMWRNQGLTVLHCAEGDF